MVVSSITTEIERILEKMATLEPGSKEYSELMDKFLELDRAKLAEEKSEIEEGRKDLEEELAQARLALDTEKFELTKQQAEEEANKNFFQKIDPSTWVSVALHFGGILLVGHFEEFKVLSQKMFSLIHKPRLKLK